MIVIYYNSVHICLTTQLNERECLISTLGTSAVHRPEIQLTP